MAGNDPLPNSPPKHPRFSNQTQTALGRGQPNHCVWPLAPAWLPRLCWIRNSRRRQADETVQLSPLKLLQSKDTCRIHFSVLPSQREFSSSSPPGDRPVCSR